MIEKLKEKKRIYKGNVLDIYSDTVILPNMKTATREYVSHPGAVAVIPFVDKNRIILVRQYRHPVEKITYEIPAGKLSKGENPLGCVKRELEEETGYRAGSIKKILAFWPTPAFSTEVLHIYTARNLKKTESCPDDDEFIETVIVSLKTAVGWVKTGKIMDSKSVIGLLALKTRITS